MLRTRIIFLVGALSFIGGAFVIQACGDTEDTPAPTTTSDSGADVAPDTKAPVDTGTPEEQDAAECDLSANFTSQVPDAAIGDSGTTSGLCMACTEAKCAKELAACNADCPCQSLATGALGCYLASEDKSPTGLAACAGPFLSTGGTTQQVGLGLVGCLRNKCTKECATESFVPPDGGDAGDGGDGG